MRIILIGKHTEGKHIRNIVCIVSYNIYEWSLAQALALIATAKETGNFLSPFSVRHIVSKWTWILEINGTLEAGQSLEFPFESTSVIITLIIKKFIHANLKNQ